MVGFRPSDEDAAEMASTEAVRLAWERRRQEAVKSKSHHRRVDLQGVFESWCCARAPNSPYTHYLKELEAAVVDGEDTPAEAHLLFKEPPQSLVVTFIEELRLDPMNPRFHSICKMILDLAIAVYMGQGAKTR